MPHANLTSKFVSPVTCPADKRKVELIDTNLEGFFVEVLATGVKTYYQRYSHLEQDTLAKASEVAAETVLRAVRA